MPRLLILVLALFLGGHVPAQALPSVQIVPHKAYYKMTLGKIKQGSSIEDVSGSMIFDWSDMCDSWAQQQYINFRFSYADGSAAQTKSTIMTSETKDGQDFTFYVKRMIDGEEDETLRGRALLSSKENVAKFSLPPKVKDLILPEGTVFPTQHILMMIQKAKEDKKLFIMPVFDGAQKEGTGEISTFIGERKGAVRKGEVSDKLLQNSLLTGEAWPMRMAFYEPNSQHSQPEYEMDIVMQANGIARTINIDYGEFQIMGRLTKIEKAPRISCPQ